MANRLEVDAVLDKKVVALDERATRAAAFTRLADEHLDAAYRLAHAILGSRPAAEDATHDALITAWSRWSQLRDATRFEPWFSRILINTCRDQLRRNSRRQTQDLSRDLSSELAGARRDPTGQVDDRDQIRAALDRLSPDHRVVVALRYYRDLPVSEIAAQLGVPAGTVNSRLHYALRYLREALDATDDPGADR